MEGVNLRYVVSTYANITMYPPPVQLLYANKFFLNIVNISQMPAISQVLLVPCARNTETDTIQHLS
jgi:hypothetical protein